MRNPHTYDIILVSTADWDNPYWTNKQHMAVQFASRGHRVFYIESQGLRQPTATSKDLKRIWNRLKRGIRPPRKVASDIYVWSPIVVPWQRFKAIRVLNRLLLRAMSSFWCRWLGLAPKIMWTYSPMTTEFYSLNDYDLVVYHAVDDIKAQPGMPRDAIEKAEVSLSQSADLIFTTAPNLQTYHCQHNVNTHYFSNVADYAHFNSAMDEKTSPPDDIKSISGPIIGFIGAISSYKLDFGLIRDIATQNPGMSFVFIGEVGEGEPATDVNDLVNLSNVHFLGGRGYKALPAYLKAFDVAILPSKINEYTRSMFPMKFFEYLAAGKPVVSTELPALVDYGDVAVLTAGTSEAFSAAIRRALAGDTAPLERRLTAAREQTYDARTDKMWALVKVALQRREISS